jgi:hypothetical protein
MIFKKRTFRNRSSIFFYPYEGRSTHDECGAVVKIPVSAGIEFWSSRAIGRYRLVTVQLRRDAS